MKIIIICLAVGMIANAAETEVTEYERSGSCNFTQECVYKYHTVQYTLGEKDRETISLSTNVHWHCESSGSFGTQPANEFCFTLFNTSVTSSNELNSSASIHYAANGHDEMSAILRNKLKGDFCYVQTNNGRIVSIHHSPTESEEAINIKRGITGAFQANFDNQEEVEESDPGSTHVSHYSFAETSSDIISFTRTFKTSDLIEVTGGAPKDSLTYTKTENSTFINKILYRSIGMLKSRIEFGHEQNSESSSDTFNPTFDFGKEFEANGTYVLERVYCKQKSKRSLVFDDLALSNVQKGSLKATINLDNVRQHKMRKIRNYISSISGFLEKIRRNPNNAELVESLHKLLKLEATYGTPSQHTSTINQLINYYKQIQASNKPEDMEMRKILYTLFSADGSLPSQKVLASALKQHINEEERDVLMHQLVLIKNASLELVNTVIGNIHGNDDGIILVLGALARNNNFAIQKVVVDVLLNRLSTVISSGDNEVMITLIYALGNSGSKLAISPILSTLEYDDIDIQISAIRSLTSHLDQPVVQQAIVTLLPKTDEDKILEETLKILIDAYENKILTNPSEELINAIINSAIQLENPNLYELAAKYLHQMKLDEVDIDIYTDLLKQQHNYGDLQHDYISDMDKNNSIVKRGSDWDENDPDYNMVASYYHRRSDVTKFPKHKAYIWGKTFGVSNLKMKVGVGGFAGMDIKSSNVNYKLYARAAANVNVFGKNYKIVDFEISRHTSGSYIYDKIYVRDGSSWNRNTNTKVKPLCVKTKSQIGGSIRIINAEISIYVYVGYIYVDITGSVSVNMKWGLCTCLTFPPLSKPKARCNADLTLSFALRVTGDTYTTLLEIYRVGIEVSSTLSYSLYPDMRIEASVAIPDIFSDDDSDKCLLPLLNIVFCVYLHHGWDVHGEIYPWYEEKKVSVSWWSVSTYWTPKTKVSSISADWSTYKGKSLLLSYCPTAIASCLT